MYPFKRVLVCLDLSTSDDAVINYSAWFSKILGAEHITFLHVSKRLDIPELIKEKYPDIDKPVDDSIKDEIDAKLKGKFDADMKVHVTVREGNFTDQTLRIADVKKADLIILGKKTNTNYQGLNARRLANTCKCSVLLVPDVAVPKAETILMPVNFTKLSLMALELAEEVRRSQGSKILVQNIYKVPNGYRYTGKTFDDFAKIMRENAEKEYHSFCKAEKIDHVDLKLILSLGDLGKAAESVFNEVIAHEVDLLIVGSRGRTRTASLILGSTAVGLIRPDLEVPYLIVKNKAKSNMGVISAIQEI